MIGTCVNCKIELRPYMIGVNVVEYADKKPYRIWSADEWCCPICNIKVVIRFANKPVDSWEDKFEDVLIDAMRIENQGKLREVFERPLKVEDDQDDSICVGHGEPPVKESA
jgi:hypothetical protein